MQENVNLSGYVRYRLIGSDGLVKQEWEKKNLVVTAGKVHLAAWLAAASQSTSFAPYVAVGSGTTAAQLTDTALETEITRVAGVVTSASNVLQNVATLGPGVATGAITEASLQQLAVAGTMFARQTFAVVNKGAADTLEVTWQVTVS